MNAKAFSPTTHACNGHNLTTEVSLILRGFLLEYKSKHAIWQKIVRKVRARKGFASVSNWRKRRKKWEESDKTDHKCAG